MAYHWTDSLRTADTFARLQAVTLAEARRLGEADGATFVVRDGDRCFYVDEDAIAPLWKGQRFPLSQCISGWAMRHGGLAEVPDIRVDDRIPQQAYRPTFVRSLVMAPMGGGPPALGSVGVYWTETGRRLSPQSLTEFSDLAIEAGRAILRLGIDTAPWAPNFRSDADTTAAV